MAKSVVSNASAVPWYKQKLPRQKYLEKGEPMIITGAQICVQFPDWVPLTEEQIELWEDSRSVVLNKNKKREFRLSPCEAKEFVPKKKENGNYSLEIEVLHLDYSGFIYSENAETKEELEKKFWPTADKLISHVCSPKIKDKKLLNKITGKPKKA